MSAHAAVEKIAANSAIRITGGENMPQLILRRMVNVGNHGCEYRNRWRVRQLEVLTTSLTGKKKLMSQNDLAMRRY